MYFIFDNELGLIAGGYAYSEGLQELREKRKKEKNKKFYLIRLGGKV